MLLHEQFKHKYLYQISNDMIIIISLINNIENKNKITIILFSAN